MHRNPGVARGDAVTVDGGALVELVGDAGWRSDDGAQGGFGEARRVLEITGTEDRPVVLRRVAAPVGGEEHTTTAMLPPGAWTTRCQREPHTRPSTRIE